MARTKKKSVAVQEQEPHRVRRRFQYDSKLGKVVEVVDPPRKTSGIVQWNYSSWAMGCNSAAEVARAQAELAKHGVRTEYDSNHEPIIRSKQHFREHARALGFHHRNGGYYDP